MTKKAKMKQIIDKICKSKDFNEISTLREELDYLLDKTEDDKVRAWLKKNAAERSEHEGRFKDLKSVW